MLVLVTKAKMLKFYRIIKSKTHVLHSVSYIHSNEYEIKDIMKLYPKHPPDNISIKGWMTNIIKVKDKGFIKVVDETSLQYIQAVIPNEMLTDKCQVGSYVRMSGQLEKSKSDKQPFDLNVEEMDVVGTVEKNIEGTARLALRSYTREGQHHAVFLENYRQNLHLRCRTEFGRALLRVRNAATQAVHRFYQDHGYIEVHTPILTSNDCEGAGETFEVKPTSKDLTRKLNMNKGHKQHFFHTPAYLTVSGQLQLEVINAAMDKVYTFSPAFRAENSIGTKHLSEFYMIESETMCSHDIEDINSIMENLVKSVTRDLLEKHSEDLAFFWQHKEAVPNQREMVEKMIDQSFHRMDYAEAIDILEKYNSDFTAKLKWGDDLQKEHEDALVNHLGGVPVFVQHYPADLKPFYARANADQKTVSCVDLVCPHVGELCGGSLREERLGQLQAALAKSGLKEQYDWYVDLRRYASVPHGGFGLGFERYLMLLLGIKNIRDTLPFPRYVRQCKM